MVNGMVGTSNFLALDFERNSDEVRELEVEGALPFPFPAPSGSGWQSNGGPSRNHLARVKPLSLEFKVPAGVGVEQFHLIGIFALFAELPHEGPGTLGGSLQFMSGKEIIHRVDLLNGRHYSDPSNLSPSLLPLGDGCVRTVVGVGKFGDQIVRVDHLAFQLPFAVQMDRVVFRDLGSPASFVFLDALFETKLTARCPFHSMGGGIPLSELGAIIRLRDRVRFVAATEQFESSLLKTADLDEARGEALTFLAVITAGLLEAGGSRSLHRVQLDAAREFDRIDSHPVLLRSCRLFLEEIAGDLLHSVGEPTARLMDRALMLIERNFANDITDETMSHQLGLSTSHFRFLFKQATQQPFHKYLVSVRLEKARTLLESGQLTVGEVAKAVGFHSLPHFSRVFTQRFSGSPNDFRKVRR